MFLITQPVLNVIVIIYLFSLNIKPFDVKIN